MIDTIKAAIPEFAKDARINISKVLDCAQPEGLSSEQILGSALAVAYHLKNEIMIDAIKGELSETVIDAAKLAASLMAMTNVYYRFIHLAEIPNLNQVPAGLRMQGMMNPGVDKVTFEVMSLAVSILNGCGACISAHCHQLKEHSLSDHALARIGRISAVVHAVHVSMGIQ